MVRFVDVLQPLQTSTTEHIMAKTSKFTISIFLCSFDLAFELTVVNFYFPKSIKISLTREGKVVAIEELRDYV